MWTNNGLRMAWYGQKYQTAESKITLRMLGSEDGGVSIPKSPVLLFIRIVGGAYVFCGSVQAYHLELQRQPIKIIWELEDFKHIHSSPDWKEVVGDMIN